MVISCWNPALAAFRSSRPRRRRWAREVISSSIGGRVALQPGAPALHLQLGLQRVGDGLADLRLDREGVVELAVVGLGPDVEAVLHADQLGGHPQPVAVAPDAALDHVGDAQPLADLAQVLVLALEIEGRGAAGDLQVRHLGQAVDHLLGQPVGEIVANPLGAERHERQHRHRLVRRAGAQDRRACRRPAAADLRPRPGPRRRPCRPAAACRSG